MTREELKKHCKKQIEGCEIWAKHNGEEPHGKVYEEHKLILELLEQESVLNKIRNEIENVTPKAKFRTGKTSIDVQMMIPQEKVLQIIDKYNAESEV
jgi:hypothetical protein